MKIYLITGFTGEYSDYQEWAVKAFRDEKKAEEFCRACGEAANFLKSTRPEGVSCWEDTRIHPLDTKFVEDYTGTSYSWTEVELEY